MSTNFPMKAKLRQGQVLLLHATRGTIIIVTHGDICVLPAPEYVGDTSIQRQIRIKEGEAHVLQENGWVTVRAYSNAEIQCDPLENHSVSLYGHIAVFLSFIVRRLSGLPLIR